ncbi:MAG: rRNA maturation RNase YbeY [Candidatus Magasanikbacteria bacterium]
MDCVITCSVKKNKVSDKYINEVVSLISNTFPKYKNFGLSINLVGEKKIKKLNNAHRNVNKTTDVLAFALQDTESFKNEKQDLGDVFICLPKIKNQAKEFRVSFEEEFARILVHGVLHLLGFDHIQEIDAKKMFSLQEKIVKKLI